jgi:hypothetical protein
VVGASCLECGEPAIEAGELIGVSLAIASAISSTFMLYSIALAELIERAGSMFVMTVASARWVLRRQIH